MFLRPKYSCSIQEATKIFRAFYLTNAPGRSDKLAGKIAIVTGSTDGIGLAIATRLARDGATVVVSSRKEANVKRTVDQLTDEGLSVWGIPCHVGVGADRDALIKETMKKYGGIDLLVCNAAVNPAFGPILDCTESKWDKLFEVNVKAPFLLSQAVVPIMREQKSGSIIHISSIAGYVPLPGLGAYSVTKTALFGLTKALAFQCAEYNIRVNCVAPGLIETAFSGVLTKNEELFNRLIEMIPMKRLGKPYEVEGIVSFLASDDASYVTGETIVVAGGGISRI